jgi:hypothetical protein
LPEDATPRVTWETASRRAPWIAIAVAAAGVFATWTSAGPVGLDGVEGPNNGWLVLILAGLALAWTRSMIRGSWTGVVGVFGAGVVMGWAALESWLDARDAAGASAGWGLLLVVLASAALAASAVDRGVELASRPLPGGESR